jgi:hypothetical protein
MSSLCWDYTDWRRVLGLMVFCLCAVQPHLAGGACFVGNAKQRTSMYRLDGRRPWRPTFRQSMLLHRGALMAVGSSNLIYRKSRSGTDRDFRSIFLPQTILITTVRQNKCLCIGRSAVTSSVGLSDRRRPWTAAAEPVHGCTLFGVSDKPTLGGAVRPPAPAGTAVNRSKENSINPVLR